MRDMGKLLKLLAEQGTPVFCAWGVCISTPMHLGCVKFSHIMNHATALTLHQQLYEHNLPGVIQNIQRIIRAKTTEEVGELNRMIALEILCDASEHLEDELDVGGD